MDASRHGKAVTSYVIEGAQVLLPDGLVGTTIRVEDGRIVEIGAVQKTAAHHLNGRGKILLPAMVDIHGDAFERQVMPRPNVYFPMDFALMETDRQLAGAGIATAYHALTLSWGPGLRSVAQGELFIDALNALHPRFSVDNRIQLRWETFAFEAIDLIKAVLNSPMHPSIAFNDHVSMEVRPIDMPVTERPFDLKETADFTDEGLKQRTSTSARRAGLSNEDYIDLLAEIWQRKPQVADHIAEIAALGRARGIPMLSHDDSQIETREHFSALGAKIAEFPMCEEAARQAKARGEWIVLGAPNVVRGGSHIGSLSAADMIEAGICDILASDYFYPAMLGAIARLRDENRAGLANLWATVSSNPAAASGLTDRGVIAVGKRADLVLLDWPDGTAPAVQMTMSNGNIAHMHGDVLA